MRCASALFDGDEDNFIRHVLRSRDWSVVSDAFAAVPQSSWDYADESTLARAVLAAGLLVLQRGDVSLDEPNELFEWALDREDPGQELVREGCRALRRTLELAAATDEWKPNTSRDALTAQAKSVLTSLEGI